MTKIFLLTYLITVFLFGNITAQTSSSHNDPNIYIRSIDEALRFHSSIQERIKVKKERLPISELLKMYDAINRFELDSIAAPYQLEIALEYFYIDSLSKSLLFTTKSIASFDTSNPNYDALAQAHNLDGILNMEFGNFSKSIDGFTSSMETYLLYEPSRVTYPIGNLSNVYYLIGDIENAIRYTKEAVQYSKQMEGEELYYNYGYDCSKLGDWYDELNESDSSTYYLQKSMSLVSNLDTSNINHKNLFTMVNEQAYKYHLKRNNIKNAKKYLDKVITTSSDLTSLKKSLLKAKYDLAIGDQENLNKFLDQPLDEMSSLEGKIDFLKFKLEVYKKNNQDKKALLAYEKLQELKTNDAKVNQQQYAEYAYAQFETFEKEKEIQRLTKISQIATLESQKQKAIYFGVFALMIGLFSGIFFFYYFKYRRKDRFNEQLEKEVERNTNDLSTLNDILINKNEELERFNYILFHDLKEPIRSIVSFSNLIFDKADKQKEVQEFSGYITNAGNQLNLLVQGISEFQSAEQFQIKKEPINLSEIVSNFKMKHRQLIEGRNVKIIEENLSEIFSCQKGLTLIFNNLITNGIKFNNTIQPTIWISMEEQENEYNILFRDNGIGIHETYFDQIFTMFKRLHNRQDFQGPGLGLAICYKVALKLNSKIEVASSTIDEGTTIRVTIKKGQQGMGLKTATQVEDESLVTS